MEEINPNQKIETNAYVPTYKVKPEFKDAVLKAVGKYPFNQIRDVVSAVNVEIIDHSTLVRVIEVLGNFPYLQVSHLLLNINNFVEQITEE